MMGSYVQPWEKLAEVAFQERPGRSLNYEISLP